MGDKQGHRRVARMTGFGVLCVVVASLLLPAAGLRGRQWATQRTPLRGVLDSPRSLAAGGSHGTALALSPTNGASGWSEAPDGAIRSNRCGAVTLYCICRLAGKPVAFDCVRRRTRTSSSGTSMLNLKEAASTIRFRVAGRQASFDLLQRHVRRPSAYAILHTVGNGGGHFVGVVDASDGGIIRVVDAVKGVHDFDEQGFLSEYDWDGNMLLLWTDVASRRETR